jgi:hypothetical protein
MHLKVGKSVPMGTHQSCCMTTLITMSRKISIQGEGDGTACAVVNQLWARLSYNKCKYFIPGPTVNITVR